MGSRIGWYRLYDHGELGVQIMHYKLDGTPGQCCTVDRDRVAANVEALESDWRGFGFYSRHDAPFAWEASRMREEAWNEAQIERRPLTAIRPARLGYPGAPLTWVPASAG